VAKVPHWIPLISDVSTLPAATGGKVIFDLNAGVDGAFRPYLLLGSISGTKQGIPLPGGLVKLPLKWDGFTQGLLQWINTPALKDFMGILDDSGFSTAELVTERLDPAFIGVKMYYAFCLSHPFDFVSNPALILIVP
jgi:hypothetical protein